MTTTTDLIPVDHGRAVLPETFPEATGRAALAVRADGLDRNPAAVYLASLSPGSRPTMARALGIVAGIVTGAPPGQAADFLALPWGALRFQHTAAIRAALAAHFSPTTANRVLSALRGVLRAAWRLGQMSAEDMQRAADVGRVAGERVIAGRAVSAGELAALLRTCDATKAGIRDAAIISLLYAGGLRRAELVGLNLADYAADSAAGRLLVHGKGNKQRVVPVAGGAALALAEWVTVRGDVPGPLFMSLGNRRSGGRLTTQAVYAMLTARAAAAGVAHLSPHDLRRSFVGDLLDAGADIATVQRLAGHANPATTSKYDRRDERARVAAVGLLHVPYSRRLPVGQ